MALGDDVEGFASAPSQYAHLVCADARDDAAVLHHTLCSDNNHVDLAQRVCDSRVGNGGHRDVVVPQVGDNLLAFFRVGRVRGREDVDDLEADCARFGRPAQQRAYHSGTAICEYSSPVADEVLAKAGNLLPALLRSFHKQLAVGQEVVAYRAEVVFGAEVEAGGAVERGDEVALEEVGAGREGDWVRDRSLQGGRVAFEEVECLGDGRHGALRNRFDEGFDGRNGHGELGVIFEDPAVGRDNVERGQRFGLWNSAHGGGDCVELRLGGRVQSLEGFAQCGIESLPRPARHCAFPASPLHAVAFHYHTHLVFPVFPLPPTDQAPKVECPALRNYDLRPRHASRRAVILEGPSHLIAA